MKLIIWLTGFAFALATKFAYAEQAPSRNVPECGVIEERGSYDPLICGYNKPLREEDHCPAIYKEDFNEHCPRRGETTWWGPWTRDFGSNLRFKASDAPFPTNYCKHKGWPFAEEPGCGPAGITKSELSTWHTSREQKVSIIGETQVKSLSCGSGRMNPLARRANWFRHKCKVEFYGKCRHETNPLEGREKCETQDQRLWTVNQCEAGKRVEKIYGTCPIWKTESELSQWISSRREELPQLVSSLATAAQSYYAQEGGEGSFWCMIQDFQASPIYAGRIPELKDTFKRVFATSFEDVMYDCSIEEQEVPQILEVTCDDDSVGCSNAMLYQLSYSRTENILKEIEKKLIEDVVPRNNKNFRLMLDKLATDLNNALGRD